MFSDNRPNKDSDKQLNSDAELPDLFGSDDAYEHKDAPAKAPAAKPAAAPTPAAEADPFIGSMLSDRYKVIALLGQGEISKVYRVQHSTTSKMCAAKVMHAHLISEPQAVQRFQKEATAASRLNHVNAISVMDLGMAESGQPFLIMELLEGISLADEIRKRGKLDIKRCQHIFSQACAAVGHAHEKGIVHRDLKPSNIMLVDIDGDPDFVKVLDFGIAKVLPTDGVDLAKLAADGQLIGNPMYMSPEQCHGDQLDATSDVYSLACVLYESITGWPPFEANNDLEVIGKQVKDMPPQLAGVAGDARTVKRMEQIIFKAMAKLQDARYQSMRDFKQDLDEALEPPKKGLKAIQIKPGEMEPLQVFRGVLDVLNNAKHIILSVLLVVVLIGSTVWGTYYWYTSYKDPDIAQRIIPVKRAFSPTAKDPKDVKKALDDLLQEEQKHDKDWTRTTPDGLILKIKKGDLYRQLGEDDRAMQEYQVALNSIQGEKKLEQILAVQEGQLEARIAEFYLKANKLGEAMQYSLYAQRKFKETGTHGTPDVLIAYSAMIAGQARQGQFPNADMTFTALTREMIAAQNRAMKEEDQAKASELGLQLALAWQGWGDCLFLQGQYDDAGKYYQMCLQAWPELGPEAQFNIGATYNQLGMLDDLAGAKMKKEGSKDVYASTKFGTADSNLQQAQKIVAEKKGKDNLDYARVLFNIADVLWNKEKYQESIQMRLEARRLWSKFEGNTVSAAGPATQRKPVN